MVNQDGSPLEEAIRDHQRLIEQDGILVRGAIELEKVRIEAAKEATKKAPPPATQIISAPQTTVSGGGYAIRDIFRPLEALVLQGPASVGGAEPFRNLVFERISGAVRQIYTNSGYNDPGIISWYPKENKGWSNDLIYICNSCYAVQRKDNKEKLTTSGEYALIREAFSKAGVLMHSDTAWCSEEEKGKKEAYAQGASPVTPTSAPKETSGTFPYLPDSHISTTKKYTDGDISRAGAKTSEEIKALQKSIGGEWYQDGTGSCWNSLYLFCVYSRKAYSRRTGEELKSPDVAKVFEIIFLSVPENLCPAQPGYDSLMKGYVSLMKGYVLPEAAKLHAPINCQGHK